ncbi:MAG: site-specific integrase [Euryarchaeota archaeon]|nr:site-specific integrase [Euryarchaeota archaeon]
MTGDDEPVAEAEELVTSFYRYLTVEKGLNKNTASNHAGEIELFATYLEGYDLGTLMDVTGMDIEEYLGCWYIRKVASSRSDLRRVPASFKKFYKFLHERGYLDDEELGDILDACKNPERYVRRLDEYSELDPYSDTWNADYERWFLGGLDDGSVEEATDETPPFNVDSVISQVFSDEDISGKTSVLDDFRAFLRYLVSNNGMKLTTANSFIRRKDLFALNKLMGSPEELKSSANQPDSRTIHLFYNLAKTLNLVVVNAKNRLEVTPRIDIFTNLSPKEQFVVLFDALWNLAEWERLLSSRCFTGFDGAQSPQDVIAAHLAMCEPGRRYNFVEELRRISLKIGGMGEMADLLINFLAISSFAWQIMPALKLFGLLDFGYEEGRNEYAVRHGGGIEWFSVTTHGGTILGSVHALERSAT